jgi:predicted permease
MQIIRDIREPNGRRTLQVLASVAVLLALICVGLAVAWKDKRDEAECWRAAFEDDEIPAAGTC